MVPCRAQHKEPGAKPVGSPGHPGRLLVVGPVLVGTAELVSTWHRGAPGAGALAPAPAPLLRHDGLGIILQEQHSFSFQTLIGRRLERHRQLGFKASTRTCGATRSPTRFAEPPGSPNPNGSLGAKTTRGAQTPSTPDHQGPAGTSTSPPVIPLHASARGELLAGHETALEAGELHPENKPWPPRETPGPGKHRAKPGATPCQGAQVKGKNVCGKIQIIKQMPGGCHTLTSRALAADLSSACNV